MATVVTTFAAWPGIATAPMGAPRPSRHTEAAVELEAITAPPPRDDDADGCAADPAPPVRATLEGIVRRRLNELRQHLGPALTENLGGRVREAAIAQGIAAPSFGWPTMHDLRFGVAATMAIRALEEEDFRAAVPLATAAMRYAPADPLGPIVGALASARLADFDAQRAFLEEAHARAEDEPAITRALAIALADGPDLARALRICETALAAAPDDARVARLRARLAERARTFAGGTRTTERTITVIGTSPTAARARDLVEAAEAATSALVGVSRGGTLVIYVYPDRASFDRGTCATHELDATFDGTIGVLATSLETERGAARLRHLAAHAALRSIAPELPAWMSEGVAEIVTETEPRAERDASARLIRDHTWIAFGTLGDPLGPVSDPVEVAAAYAQSRAMVEWVLTRPAGLAGAMAWLAHHPARDLLAHAPGLTLDGEALLTHLADRAGTDDDDGDVPSVFPDVAPVGEPESIDAARQVRWLIERLSERPEQRDRMYAALVLGRHRESRAPLAPLMRALVHDESALVRRLCAESLLLLGDPDAVRALAWARDNDEDEVVRDTAQRALVAIAAPPG